MNHIDIDDITTIQSVATCRAAAHDAAEYMQTCAVARLINEAANCGQYGVKFNQPLLDSVKSKLESKGYTIQQVGIAVKERVTYISWQED